MLKVTAKNGAHTLNYNIDTTMDAFKEAAEKGVANQGNALIIETSNELIIIPFAYILEVEQL